MSSSCPHIAYILESTIFFSLAIPLPRPNFPILTGRAGAAAAEPVGFTVVLAATSAAADAAAVESAILFAAGSQPHIVSIWVGAVPLAAQFRK